MKFKFWSAPLLLCSLVHAQTPPAAPAPKPVPAARPAQDRTPVKEQFTFSFYNWLPKGTPGFRPGQFIAEPLTRTLDLASDPRRSNGFQLTFPTGSFNRLEVGAWRVSDEGRVVTPHKLNIYGANVAAGNRLDTAYSITNARIAWNYLTWPAPPFDAKLRVKTFWEFQYTRVNPTIGFPDAKNNPAPIRPGQTIWFPGAGLGIEYLATSHFKFDARGSGMAFPKRSGYWDVEANVSGRIKNFEIFGGLKAFHFHASKRKEEAPLQGTFWGPRFGVKVILF